MAEKKATKTNTKPKATKAAEKVAKPEVTKAEGSAKIFRKFDGEVVSDKMDKTIVVRVDVVKKHPKYHKRYVKSAKFKVHDEKNQCKVGDKVSFVECRPLSRDKRWRVLYK